MFWVGVNDMVRHKPTYQILGLSTLKSEIKFLFPPSCELSLMFALGRGGEVLGDQFHSLR